MTFYWAALIGGLLGSTHCVGMCGGFAAVVGLQTKTVAGNLRAQLIYSAGRIMTYAALGGAAGFVGKRLAASLPQLVHVPAILCLIAGIFLIREGLAATGVWPRRIGGSSAGGCLLGPMFSTLLRLPGGRNTFVAGMVTGLLPCGLLYAYVALAAGTGDLLQGAALMSLFGVGTVPLMVVTGCGAALIGGATRKRLWQAAGWAVVVTGLVTVVRGGAFLNVQPTDRSSPCPFCSATESPSVNP